MATPSVMDRFPKITFDTTLADLYAIDAEEGSRVALLPCAWLSTVDLGPDYPRTINFPMQDLFIDLPEPFQLPPQLQKLMLAGTLNMISQRDAFPAGNMDVIFPTYDDHEGSEPQSKIDVERTVSSIHPSQQYRRLYISDLQNLYSLMKEQGIDSLAPKALFDHLSRCKLTCDIDVFYYINSKAAIVSSGLPTPRSTIIQLGPEGFDPLQCCSYCAADPKAVQIPKECTGPRRHWMNRQIERACKKIQARELPFVLKLNWSFGGKGTFIVTSEEERTSLIELLEKNILLKSLSGLFPSNAHLNPASLVVMDYISELVGNWGVTFFVTQKGQSIFLGASEQRLKDKVRWKGSSIDYPAQEQLKAKFTPIMDQMGQFLHSYGYYGPIGADILESPRSRNGESSTDLYVVDLNVRTSGSLNIVLLGQFLSKQRGLNVASSFFVQSKNKREELMSKISKPLEEGRIIILAWIDDDEVDGGGAVIIAGEDHEAKERTMQEFFEHAYELAAID